mmetsp:Transcript_11733/g.31570  ORF Transcript_11733/g.31570 Transcript_11733/m.31570 type:complete len:592 (+) Transcript_11733:60-1835(+)
MSQRTMQMQRRPQDATMMPWNQPRQQYSRPDHRRHFDENARSPMSSSSGLAQRAAQGQVPATLPYTTERNLQTSRPGNDDATWGDKPAYCRPHPSEVVAAVETLYADQLKPFGRILLKRVRECNAAAATAAARTSGDSEAVVDVDAVPLIDPKCLRRICETCEAIRVEPEDGKEYSALLTGRLRDFVDVSSPSDDYPPNLWAAAAAYFESLQGPEMLLPGGRYACAQLLMQRRLRLLAGFSLGGISHIVQLAISSKKILGYSNGKLVPYAGSQSMIKDRRAERQQPCQDSSKNPVASWEELRRCVQQLVGEVHKGGMPIALSSIKRLFQKRFCIELSETALGYAKVSELLQDPRLGDLCRVQLRMHGYVLLPFEPADGGEKKPNSLSLVDCLMVDSEHDQSPGGMQSALRKRAGLIQPLSMDEILSPRQARAEAAEDLKYPIASGAPGLTPNTATPCAATPAMTLFPETPSPWSPRLWSMPSQTLPTLLGRARSTAPRSLRGSGKTMGGMKVGPAPSATPSALHTLDTLVEESSLIPPPPTHSPVGAWNAKQAPVCLSPPTPSTWVSSVHNTFIHTPESPPEFPVRRVGIM